MMEWLIWNYEKKYLHLRRICARDTWVDNLREMEKFKKHIEIISPLSNLIYNANELQKHLLFANARWFGSLYDNFSHVYGLSESEISNFGLVYENTKAEVEQKIERIENVKLKNKLKTEFNQYPIFIKSEFVVNTKNLLWITKFIFPIFPIIKTLKFKEILTDIKITSEVLVNNLENSEWLEMM